MGDDTTTAMLATVDAFNEAFNTHDVDAVMNLMTDDAVFEYPYADAASRRIEGRTAIGQA